MIQKLDERNLPSYKEKSATKKDSSWVSTNIPRELVDKVYSLKGKYKKFGSGRVYKLKSNLSAASFFYEKIAKAKESRSGKYGWAVELKSKEDYASENEGDRMKLFLLDSGNSGFAITENGTLVSVFTHKDADKNDINMILAMAVEYGADKLDCYTAKNKLTDLYSKFGFKETGRTAFNHEYAPDDAPDYVKNDEFEGSQLPQNQGRTDLRPTEERPDVAFMHRPQTTPRTGSSILKSRDKHTNYNKNRTTTPSAIGGDYMEEETKNKSAATKTKVRGRQTHLQRDWMNQSVSFNTMVKNLLGESPLTRSIKNVMNESKDILTITTNDLYEWLMEIGSNSMLDEFKPHQIKAVIEMMLREGDELPQDDTQMAAWCRKNEDHIIETVARATGAYFMSKEEFAKKQQEEEEIPNVVVKGTEVLYNKRGLPRGMKIEVIDYGVVYMKRRGSNWEITDISKENDDERVWEMVQSSLEKITKKNPTTFVRLMRNRAYELPKFKSVTLGESVTLNDQEVTVRDIMRRIEDTDEKIVQKWLDDNDGWDFNNFKDIISSINDKTSAEQRFSNAVNEVSGVVHGWLHLSENNAEVTEIIRKNLKLWVKSHKNIPSTTKTIKEFIGSIWNELKPFKKDLSEIVH